jgi:hypothetical protein
MIVPMHSGLFLDLEKRLKSMTELGSKAWYDLNGLYVYITVVFLVKVFKICFYTDCGREVWIDISQGRSDPDIHCSPTGGKASSTHHTPAAVDTHSRSVRYLFETCDNHNYFTNEEERRRRMRACVEATASLICCTGFRMDWFGEVGKLVGDIGHIEKVNQSPTTLSDPLFVLRWSCLSLVTIQPILNSNRLQVLAEYAVSGLTRMQLDLGRPDEAALKSAQKIDECLRTGWELVEDLRRAFEPWEQKKTKQQVEEIPRTHVRQISELERIQVEADAMKDADRRISLYQDAMDDATHRMTRQLPGVSFDEVRRTESLLVCDDFNQPGNIPARDLASNFVRRWMGRLPSNTRRSLKA